VAITRVGVVYVMICLSVLKELRLVTDRQTDRQTDIETDSLVQ